MLLDLRVSSNALGMNRKRRNVGRRCMATARSDLVTGRPQPRLQLLLLTFHTLRE